MFFLAKCVVDLLPHAVAHNEQYRCLIQGYMLRHKVKPGITGLHKLMDGEVKRIRLKNGEKNNTYAIYPSVRSGLI